MVTMVRRDSPSLVAPAGWWAISLVITTLACGGNDPAQIPPAGPEVVLFEASPDAVGTGGRATLRWQVNNADVVDVGPVGRARLVVDGEPTGEVVTEALLEETVFELRAIGPGGTVEATVTVQISDVPPVIDRFDVEPTAIGPGQTAMLRWVARSATTVRIESAPGGTLVSDGAASGNISVSPTETSTYTLTAIGPQGTIEQSVRLDVVIPAPEIVAFDVDPSTIFEGETVKVAWFTRFADGIEISASDGTLLVGGGAEGSDEITLFETDTLTLTAVGPAGITTARRGVTVRPPLPVEIVSFEAAPNPVGLGDSTTLRWSVSNASELIIVAGGDVIFTDENPGLNGELMATVDAPETTFALIAQGPLGAESAQVVVLGHRPPTFVKFTVEPQALAAGQPATVGWIVDNVTTLSMTANGRPVPGFPEISTSSRTVSSFGELSFAIDGPTLVELTGRSAGGARTEETLVITGRDEVEPNQSSLQAQTLTGTSAAVLATAGPADADWFRISVPAGGQLFAETSFGPQSCRTDTELSLVAPDGTTVLAVDDDDGPGACSELSPQRDAGASNLAAGDYFLAVTAAANGPYVLRFTIDAPVCGDGTREGAETCDDGNVASSDGCSASCRLELAGTLNPPGGVRAVNLGPPPSFGTVAIDLDRAGQSITATAADAGGQTCNGVDTRLVLMDATFQQLGQKSGGGPSGSAGTCAAFDPAQDRFARDLAPGRYYLMATGEASTGGPIEIRATVINPSCGNGLAEQRAAEQCDDGNRVSLDGCSSLCLLETRLLTEVEPNDTQATATLTGLSGVGAITLSGANTPAGDDDVYRFDLAAGRSVVLAARTYTTPGLPLSCSSTVTDTRIYVERAGAPATNPSNQPLAFNDDIDNANNIWCSQVRGLTLSGGASGSSYFVRVQGWNDQQVTNYQLDLTLSP